ncbi:hypothetical protein PLICRDRAFT_102369 [Plicaturopsis crispa FD-325 SS-3]|nr:hypothetical protein PLICRDRAFT_102369 [Plicaturopsis crispa FD-325 SS-3]
MHTPSLSARTVVFIALLAVFVPVTIRIVSSPITLLLISPLLLLSLLVAFVVANVAIGLVLDLNRPRFLQPAPNAARPLGFSTPAAWQAVLTRSQWSQGSPQTLAPLHPDFPVVSAALNDILILIVRDFVLTWYKDISTSPSFPMAVSNVLHDSLERLANRASGIDLSALVVKRILPKVTAHIEQFRQSEVALRGARLERKLTQSEELDLLLANRYASKGGGKLHPAVDNLSSMFTKQSEEMHLRQLVDRALPYVLPETEGKSKALKVVVKEIVACAVLYPVMEMVADPDFWNRAIDQVAGAAIHQQRLITKVRNVLEAQSPRSNRLSTVGAPSRGPRTETITIHTDIKQFESFLRSISRCSSLLDARRLKNDVVGEIRRTRTLLANHENEDWIDGQKTEDVVAFLDRLYTAKRKVEKRIVVLGGEEDLNSAYPETSAKPRITLRDVLGNPSSLSYFMEFMDRRHRSLLVQFWLTVESFKNPLESIDSGSDEDEPIHDPSSKTAREDISMINDLYFSAPSPHPALASISKKYVDAVREFAAGELPPSPATERRVRRSVMLAQSQVEQDMEQDFDDFERSELWFRVIGDPDFGAHRKGNVDAARPDQRSPLNQATPLPRSSTPSLKQGRSAPPLKLQRSESSPLLGVQNRPASTRSDHSSATPPTPGARPSPSNIELLMSPVEDSETRAPLFDDPLDGPEAAERDRMEAIQAALTDIIAGDDEQDKPRGQAARSSDRNQDRAFRLGNIPESKRRRAVFEEDEADDEQDDDEGDDEDRPDDSAEGAQGSFQLAAPGDLQLSYEIQRLGDKVSNLQAQDLMLDSLIKKAELTGDTQELKLLSRSKSSMGREIRELQFQKAQYEQQESANRLLSDRTRVKMATSTVGDEEGKSVVRYLVEVQQLGPDGSFASGWVVARRYNEFLNMHNKLRERYGMVRHLDFPGKRLVTALSGSFVDSRRVALEKYMQSLISIPVVCESEELRNFLSRESPFMASEHPASKGASSAFSGKDLVRTVYRSVAESIDDMFFGPSMLDVMIQRLTRQAAEFAGIVGSGVTDEDLVAQALKMSGQTGSEATFMRLPGDLKPLDGETSSSTFSAPICDLVLAIFELNKKNNWLRRQAIVIILQQVLGGTIERKIRENIRFLLDETRIMSFITIFRDGLWPGGQLKTGSPPRSNEDRARTRDEANRKLSALIPDLAANMIGRSNARRGARRIFAVLQNRRLNQHIAYTVVDEVRRQGNDTLSEVNMLILYVLA